MDSRLPASSLGRSDGLARIAQRVTAARGPARRVLGMIGGGPKYEVKRTQPARPMFVRV